MVGAFTNWILDVVLSAYSLPLYYHSSCWLCCRSLRVPNWFFSLGESQVWTQTGRRTPWSSPVVKDVEFWWRKSWREQQCVLAVLQFLALPSVWRLGHIARKSAIMEEINFSCEYLGSCQVPWMWFCRLLTVVVIQSCSSLVWSLLSCISEQTLALSRICAVESLMKGIWRESGAQESWLLSKDHFL